MMTPVTTPATTPLYDLCAVGNVCADIIADIDDNFLSHHSMVKGACTHYPDAASFHKVAADLVNPIVLSGGVGANVAHVTQALGGASCFQGKAGHDAHAKTFVSELTSLGIKVHCPRPEDTSCGSSLVMCLNTPDGDRTFGSYDGAGKTLQPADLDTALVNAAAFFYFDGYALVSPEGAKVFSAGHDAVHRQGGLSCFNPCDISVIEAHPDAIKHIKTSADMVICNLNEARALFGDGSTEVLAQHLANTYTAGAITDGENGATVFQRGQIVTVEAPSTLHLATLDSNGAGDHFAAGFLYGLRLDLPLIVAGKLGQLCALDCLSHKGARPIGSLQHLVAALTKI